MDFLKFEILLLTRQFSSVSADDCTTLRRFVRVRRGVLICQSFAHHMV